MTHSSTLPETITARALFRVVWRALNALLSLRAIMVTGKGGVGKTTITAALAQSFAAMGKRTLAAEMTADGIHFSR